uniref:Uncharacterized protein n=1 Tax=Rhizophora mucronata TaxID=61149 RepID=A0A2P2M424_RHIMU
MDHMVLFITKQSLPLLICFG